METIQETIEYKVTSHVTLLLPRSAIGKKRITTIINAPVDMTIPGMLKDKEIAEAIKLSLQHQGVAIIGDVELFSIKKTKHR